eukprot:3611152-Rhodomonas_salina.1
MSVCAARRVVEVLGVEAADLEKQRAVKAGGDKTTLSSTSNPSGSAPTPTPAPSDSTAAPSAPARAPLESEEAPVVNAALTAAMDAPIPVPRFVGALSSSRVPPAESLLPSSQR